MGIRGGLSSLPRWVRRRGERPSEVATSKPSEVGTNGEATVKALGVPPVETAEAQLLDPLPSVAEVVVEQAIPPEADVSSSWATKEQGKAVPPGVNIQLLEMQRQCSSLTCMILDNHYIGMCTSGLISFGALSEVLEVGEEGLDKGHLGIIVLGLGHFLHYFREFLRENVERQEEALEFVEAEGTLPKHVE